MMQKAGIVIADEMEFEPFAAYAQNRFSCRKAVRRSNESLQFTVNGDNGKLDVTAVKCGIGKVNAAAAAAFLIADEQVDFLLNAGLSGAIQGVRREEIVIGSSYLEADFDLTAIGYALGVKPGQEYCYEADKALLTAAVQALPEAKTGRFGCGDIFLADPARKKLYGDTFEICAFDMETGAIAAVCRKSGVPFLSIRKISDDADDSATEDYQEMNNRAEADLTECLFRLIDRL